MGCIEKARSPDMPLKVTWWQATKYVLWKLCHNNTLKELAPSVMIFICVCGGPFMLNTALTRINDYSPPFPPIEATREDSGMLSQIRISKRYYWKLVMASGQTILLQPEGYYWQPTSDKAPPIPAEIRWFSLPSGVGNVATLKINGKVLGTYEQMRTSYQEALAAAYDYRNYAVAAFLIGFLLLLRRIVAYRNSSIGVDIHVD